jgi:hypothetical protein
MPYFGGSVSITTPPSGSQQTAGTTFRIAGETTPRTFIKPGSDIEREFPPNQVSFRLDGGGSQPTTKLTADWANWEASLQVASPGPHTIVVVASWATPGGYTATASITVNISQVPVGPLPPGAEPQRLVVPAFWSLETVDTKYTDAWKALQRAGSSVRVVVFGANYVAATKNVLADPTRTQQEKDTWLNSHRARLDDQPGIVLGYVSTRSTVPDPTDPTGMRFIYPLQPINEILNGKPASAPNGDDSVKAWYDIFGGHIDGIYFDELVLPEMPGSVAEAQQVIAQFRAVHPKTAADAQLMILAGQCLDPYVVGAEVDWALLWEGRINADPPTKTDRPYRESFTARLEQPPQPSLRPIPSWWKDPANRSKIVHVVHNCDEPSRQGALSLANERNAGNVFVMDRRGGPTGELYDHMPPYWDVEVREVNSYYDFGFDPLRALRAAGRYGAQQGMLHAWPNFEAAWYGSVHVRGTFLIHAGVPGITRVPLALADLPADAAGKPPLHDIPRVWHAAHHYAQNTLQKATAIPVFEPDPNFSLIVFDPGVVQPVQVPLASTYEQPSFAEPGWVIRNVNRVTGAPTFCSFEPDNPNRPQGVDQHFNCYTVNPQNVTWQDVQTSTYIAQL